MVAKPPVKPIREDQRFEPDQDEAQREPVGRIIIAWAKLEAALEDLVWHFLDLCDDDGRVITCRMDARSKVELLRVFGSRVLPLDELPLYTKWLSFIAELQDSRNFAAHGLWGVLQPENVPVAMSLKPKAELGQIVSESFPKERMDAIYDGITKARRSALKLRDRLAEVRPRAPKPRLA